ncbi:MAG: UDP-N-acetylmuramate--L-alanine ligase [Prochlorotrichaceae cyanobacterium]
MINSVDLSGRPFHFIGIGGIGMSALAQVLAGRNVPISGSDLRLNHITQRLEKLGAHIFEGQLAQNLNFFQFQAGENLQDAAPVPVTPKILPQVVCSTAISTSNAEYRAALDLGCPIFHRSDLLAALIHEYSQSIAVSGTHGKTTTSALLSHTLHTLGLDPTVIVGGEIQSLGTNARLGHSNYLVAEADESDGSLVKFHPQIGIVTNIELDHPDHYSSLEKVIETFQQFGQQCKVLVGCLDSPCIAQHLALNLTYSLHPDRGAHYSVAQVEYQGNGTIAEILEHGTPLGTLKLQLLGSHNLSNALAIVAVGRHLGLPFSDLAAAMAGFGGTKRRFEYRGDAHEILFVDDYAHHPSEIQVTLAAARLQIETKTTTFPVKPARIVAIFQPHRYSRTQALLTDFAQSFGDADVVVLSDIYGAGEPRPENFDGSHLANQVAEHHPQVQYCASLEAVSEWLCTHLQPGDLALFLGAGNLNQVIPLVLQQLQSRL